MAVTTWPTLGSDESIFAGKVALNAKEYGVKGDGSTDDTATIQAFINTARGGTVLAGVPGANIVFPSGEYVLSDTVTFNRYSGIVAGQGLGQSPSYTGHPGKGTVFRWNGSSNVPMFKVVDSQALTFTQFRLEGKNSSMPTYGIEFNNAGGSAGSNELLTVRDVWIGKFPWSSQGANVGAVQSGIGFTGNNADNDQFHIENVVFKACATAGIDLPNSQSIWGETLNCLFDTCGIGFRTAATTSLFNATFNECAKDVEVNGSAMPVVHGWYSENSHQIFDLVGDTGISVYGGTWLIGSNMQGAPYIAHAAALVSNVIVDGVQVLYQITPKPPLSLTGSATVNPNTIAIRACTGLDAATLSDVQGYGAPGHTYVDIATGGYSYRGNVVSVPPKPYQQTKTANYSLTAADRVIVANGASLALNLPDPTLTPTDREFVIKNVAATAVTVASLGTSKTIDGAASKSLAQWAIGRYVCDGTQWLSV